METDKTFFVHPDEVIYTKRGPKKIHTLTIADFVATANGSFISVAEVYKKNYAGKLYQIQAGSSVGVVHESHELLVRHGDHSHYCPAKDITPDMSIISVFPHVEMDDSNVTCQDLTMYGIILSIGVLSDAEEDDLRVDIPSTMMSKFVKDYAETKKLNAIQNDDSGVITMDLPFPRKTIFDSTGRKVFYTSWALLPTEKLVALKSGISVSNPSEDAESIQVESSDLAEQLRTVFYRCGEAVEVSGSRLIKVPSAQGRWVDSNTFLRKIESIDVVDFDGTLFDLKTSATEDSNSSYLTKLGINHNGGGKRNGSFAIYLEPWHADIVDFLELKKPHGEEEKRARDLFYALWIPDLFMKRVETGDVWSLMDPNVSRGLADVWGEEFENLYQKYESEQKFIRQLPSRELWNMILVSQIETGTPYMLYKDSINRKSNQSNLGTIKSSNLCVHPETPILTRSGHVPIGDLDNQNIEIWNGTEFSNVKVIKTGKNQKLLELNFNNGRSIKCTPYHKFHIVSGARANKIKIVSAEELTDQDRLIRADFPTIEFDDNDFPYAYTHGFYCGDGTVGNKSDIAPRPCHFRSANGTQYCLRHKFHNVLRDNEMANEGQCQALSYNPQPQMSLYGEKKELIKNFDIKSSSEIEDAQARLNVTLPLDIAEKFVVPFGKSLKIRLDWLAGYCDADGSIAKNGANEGVQIASSDFDFLGQVQMMLQTMGVDSRIGMMNPEREAYLPDGKGGRKLFQLRPVYRMIITNRFINHLLKLGWAPKRLKLTGQNIPNRDARHYVKLINKTPVSGLFDTYCFHEPKKNLGVFNGLLTGQCCEITEFTSPEECAVCNLASVSLPSFVDKEDVSYDLDKLHATVKVMTRNLNKVIDVNYYPVQEAETSNIRHRPIGIGIQGLADVFCMLKYPFESQDARKLNRDIAETMYHAALEASCELAAERESEILEYKQLARIEEKTKEIKKQINGILKRTKFSQEELTRPHCQGAYDSYFWNGGCPVSKGILQYDMWDVSPSERWDWAKLKEDIETHGIRNSLLIAPMPTASTSQILGNAEAFEPYTSNIFTRRTMAGEFAVVNKHLMRDLIEMGLWNDDMKQQILAREGSVQDIDSIPKSLRAVYKTVWEVSQKTVIDMAADRGAFTCQSMSQNIYISIPTPKVLTSMHMYGWRSGNKCGSYYIRCSVKAKAQQFTVDPRYNSAHHIENSGEKSSPVSDAVACSLANRENCEACSG